MTKRNDMIEKIRKLLALGASGNQHEAEIAMQRASDLMKKYMIEESDVALRDAKDCEVIERRYQVPDLKMKYVWVETLTQAAATLYDCKILFNTHTLHKTVVWFVGYECDVEAAVMTFEHLWKSWHGIAKKDLKWAKEKNVRNYGGMRPWRPRDTMKFKHGHGQGYSNALFLRCLEIRDARKAEVQGASDTGNVLVVVKDQKVQDHMDGYTTINRKDATEGSMTGRIAGHDAGKAVPLGAIEENAPLKLEG